MKKIEIKSILTNHAPQYVKTQLVVVEREDGHQINWEMVNSHDSVHILVENINTNELLLVKQIRIPVLVNDDSNCGEVFELCAGIVDKDIPLIEIAKEEILEELGYDIPISNLRFMRNIKNGVGSAGRTSSLFHALIEEKHKVSEGGGLDNEDIEIIRINYDDVECFIDNKDIHTDAITLFALTHWCYSN